jgi:Tfp pilus assembly protein FimV
MSETAAAKKASARKTSAKKAAAKKSSAKKTGAKKTTAKKSTAKKAAPTKRASAKAAAAPTKSTKKTSAKKTSAKKTSAGRPRNAEALEDLAAKAEAGAGRDDRFAQFMDDIGTLARLTVAYARGEYRDLPADKLAMVVAGLLYVASPWGLLPRLLGGLGLSQVLRSLHDDLDAFRAWEAERG